MIACAMVRSLHDAAVDEDVLRPAHRALLAERRDVAVNRDAGRLLAQLDQIGRSPYSW